MLAIVVCAFLKAGKFLLVIKRRKAGIGTVAGIEAWLVVLNPVQLSNPAIQKNENDKLIDLVIALVVLIT